MSVQATTPPSDVLAAKITSIIGGRTGTAFGKSFGIQTIGDLLAHYPRRYARRGELTALDMLPLNENVTIVAEVRKVQERTMRARRGTILEVSISDGQGILTLTFFNQAWRANDLKPGVRGIFAGKVSDYRGALQLAHPDYELFDDIELSADSSAAALKWAEHPIPIYPASASLASWQIQKSIELVLDGLGTLPDPVPDDIRMDRGLLSFTDAIEKIHRPNKDVEWMAARTTLRFHEAFVLQAALLQQREVTRRRSATPRIPKPGGLLARFDAQLPFTLTGDQRLVGQEIAHDIAQSMPMSRLVQGEVGSGKTLVALRAMLAVADSGGQSALLAPTEVLAAQHLRSIVRALGPELSAELMPTLLTGQLPTAERKRALLRTVSGQARIIIGTQALLSDIVTFYDLGLVVVDEQHRFGVEQRDTLRRKGALPPHVLVLTATPIPRTVAMTVFGDLDISTISELPAGRQGISTFTVPLSDKPGWSTRVWQRMAEELALGRQAFVVCPAIDKVEKEDDVELDEESWVTNSDDDASDAKPGRQIANVVAVTAQLKANPALSGYRIEMLHGRMSSDEKDAVMRDFAAGIIHVVVATTVIEVGVDVPNASTMVVLDADRFGVSQLHQLRGRVGRGGVPGLCLLVTYAEVDSLARNRVDAVESTGDGFELAQIDLELRREGNVLGTNQSGGRSALKLLRVVNDADVILDARGAASEVLEADPRLSAHPALRSALEQRVLAADRDFLVKT